MKPFEVHVIRGSLIESAHLVDSIVIDKTGSALFQSGEIDHPVFPRSAIKMLQTLLLVETGAAKALGLDERHLALASASHVGDPRHIKIVGEWLSKIKMSEANLVCGVQDPEKKPTKMHNNCSGKHSGLLSVCRYLGYDIGNYGDFDHPVQQALRKKLSEIYDMDLDQALWGTDGCGIPTSAISLRVMVSALARFAARPAGQEILNAIAKEPDLVSGDGGFCTEVTRVTRGRIFAKTGAEGVFTALDPHRGLYFALKVRDGASRASFAGIAQLLRQQGCFSVSEIVSLSSFLNLPLRNWAGDRVGEIRVVLK